MQRHFVVEFDEYYPKISFPYRSDPMQIARYPVMYKLYTQNDTSNGDESFHLKFWEEKKIINLIDVGFLPRARGS